ncbi:hypothetical protein [Mammaliicoccus phage vB_MscM-PMS3]|nr:hypothetical protein [Mammaliicoccus phage vB_MscM-PMS3]WBF82258.1 hypothetical protein [Mammaliicoccus virus vB_MscM-PMS2]
MSSVLYVMGMCVLLLLGLYIAVSTLIYQWKHDKESFMISVALFLALILISAGLLLGGN